MSFIFALVENLLLVVALPLLVNDAMRDQQARVDDRRMFTIPFCRSLAIACGSLLAITTAVLAGFLNDISTSNLWDISGFWHQGRFLLIVEHYLESLAMRSSSTLTARDMLFVQILFALVLVLTLFNSCIALAGWRSLGAIRGIYVHIVIGISTWIILTVGALAAIWVLHWLNFWVFLVLFVVVEMRRREEATTKLSF